MYITQNIHGKSTQQWWIIFYTNKGMGKVFYGQEPPSGESTTTECGFNYQLLAVITEVAQFGTPSCSRPQAATDNGARDGRSNWLVTPPTLMDSTPWAPRALYKSVQLSHSQDSFLQPCNPATFSMRGNHLAYEATQGLPEIFITIILYHCTMQYPPTMNLN